VTNDTESGSGKNKKADELGIPIINEKDFLAIIDDSSKLNTFKNDDKRIIVQGDLFN
jgi:DNA ligase (NAD+)